MSFITVAKYWKRWSDPRIIFLVLNNRDLNQVSWEMRIESGDPKFDASQDLPDFPYARYARALRLYGYSRSTEPEQVGPAWDIALSADRARRVSRRTRTRTCPSSRRISLSSKRRTSVGMRLRRAIPDERGIMVESRKA